jgi:hypothetical protein
MLFIIWFWIFCLHPYYQRKWKLNRIEERWYPFAYLIVLLPTCFWGPPSLICSGHWELYPSNYIWSVCALVCCVVWKVVQIKGFTQPSHCYITSLVQKCSCRCYSLLTGFIGMSAEIGAEEPSQLQLSKEHSRVHPLAHRLWEVHSYSWS